MKPVIFTTLTIQPHLVDAAVELLRKVQSDVRANEPGTLFYQFNQRADDPTIIWAHEVFADEAAKRAHLDRLLSNEELQTNLAALNAAPPVMVLATEL
jgi:quinol monooxygenase YgiN